MLNAQFWMFDELLFFHERNKEAIKRKGRRGQGRQKGHSVLTHMNITTSAYANGKSTIQ